MYRHVGFMSLAAFAFFVAGCGGGGGGTPEAVPSAVATAPSSGAPIAVVSFAITLPGQTTAFTNPATSAAVPFAIARGSFKDFDVFPGSTSFRYSVASNNTSCASASVASTSTASAYGAEVIVPSAATSGCKATVSVSFFSGTTTALTVLIYVVAT